MKKIWWVVWMVTLLVACQASTASEAQPTASSEAILKSQLGKEQAVIVYTRSGGFAGVNESYEFYNDGRVVFVKDGQKSELSVSAEAVQELLAKLNQSGVLEMEAQVEKLPDAGADYMTHTIQVYQGEDKPRTLTMRDGDADLPADVVGAFEAVNALIPQAPQ